MVFPVVVVVAAMLYHSPALGHFVRTDDYVHLFQIEDLGFWRFMAGCYGIIALGRAAIYSGIGYPMLEAASVSRYHYLPQVILAVLLAQIAAKFYRPLAKPWLAVATVLASLLLMANWNWSRSINGDLPHDAGDQFAETVRSFEGEIHSRVQGRRVVIQNKPFAGGGYMGRQLAPGVAAVFMIRFPENEVDGRRVFFSEKNSETLKYWKTFGGSRLKDLLIAPRPGDAGRKGSRGGAVGVRRTKRLD